ncbi:MULTISPECIES: hypothetical protein [unclassified Methanoculleus]|uniref:hypothetical protein n=1 Tax=unclassified Methanoculleus TaxID=2619537 RepID=UPI0025D6590A|nr:MULTISPECIES: hypothetical protein [unclassified Methanoculleus]
MGSVVYPPVVTLVEPEDQEIGDPYLYGAERLFTASVDQTATLTFTLDDGVPHAYPNVTQASHSFQIPLLGVHTVRVVAQNANGSGEDYWTWNIFVTPPTIYLVDPAESEVTDPVNASRLFTARSNQYAIIRFYLDGQLKQETPVPTQNASYFHEAAPLGEHVVSVVATNSNGSGQNHWDWNVKECFSEGATKCVGYDLFECINGRWTLKEANAVQCGYPASPTVTKVSPTTDTLGLYRMNDNPPVLTVQVNQPALLTLKVDDVVVDMRTVAQVDTDVTFEQCPDFIAYMKVASHLGTHTVSIIAENGNGISDPVTWQWTLIVGIDQAAIEFEAMPNYIILGYEFEARMSDMPFFDASSFSSPGDHKLLIPSHAYTNEDHTMKKGAIAFHRDFWENSVHRFIAFTAYMWDSDGGSRCNEPDDPPNPCWIDPDGRAQYGCMKLTCNMTHTMRLDLRDRSVLKACATDDQGVWRCVRKLPVTSDESIVNIDFMSEIQWIYGQNGELPFPTADLSDNEIVLTWIRVKKIDEPESEQEKTLRPNICLKLRYSSDEYPLEPNPYNPQQGTFGARLIWTRREVQGSPGEEEFVLNFGITQ